MFRYSSQLGLVDRLLQGRYRVRSWGMSATGFRALIVFATVLLGGLAHVSGAFAAHSFCLFGSGSGQCDSPRGIATDFETGELYVVDAGNNRVNVFDAAGVFLRTIGALGQLDTPSYVAVDNGIASSARHDVYVYDPPNIKRFSPDGELKLSFSVSSAGSVRIAIGPEGAVYVADSGRVRKYDSSGVLIAELQLKMKGCGPGGDGLCETAAECEAEGIESPLQGETRGLAVDTTGAFYVATAGESGAVRKYDAAGNLLDPCEPLNPSLNISAIAVDAGNDIYLSDFTGATVSSLGSRGIHVYDSAGMQLLAFGYGVFIPDSFFPRGLTVYGGSVFATQGIGEDSEVMHIPPPPPGPLILSESGRAWADPIGNVRATVNAVVNPEGKTSNYRFEYVDDAAFKASGFATAISTPELAFGSPSDFRLHVVSAQIGCQDPTSPPQPSCLKPDTVYHFRVFASNADGSGNSPVEGIFETRPHFEILGVWASEVGTQTATVNAEVNPLGVAAKGRFEYVDHATFLASGFAEAKKTPEVDFGSSEAPQTRSAQLKSLSADTAYHYRVVVENAFGHEESLASVLTTFQPVGGSSEPPCPNRSVRIGPSAVLPDCRAYEMASPIDKNGGNVEAQESLQNSALSELNQSAAAGARLTYSSRLAFAGAQSAPYTSQYIATRRQEAEEWSSEPISPPRTSHLFNISAGVDSEFKAFSQDLEHAWIRTLSEPTLSGDAIPGYPNLYRRDNASGRYEAVCPVQPPSLKPGDYLPHLQGFLDDGSAAVYRVGDKLTPDASGKKGLFQLYGCSRLEGLRLISVLPSGAASGTHSSAGMNMGGEGFNHRFDSIHNAVSGDGSRVFWTAAIPGAEASGPVNGPGKIYLREHPFGEGANCAGPEAPCTFKVSELVSSAPAQFWTAAADGSVAIFSIGQVLYEYDAAKKEAREIAKGASGLAGWSEDASRLYLVSDEALDSAAEEGERNLYLYEAGEGGGSFELVASLAGGEGLDDFCSIDTSIPFNRCTRVTPGGEQLAFIANVSLTGYDNKDVASRERDAEVFLYDASAEGGEGKLSCVSCNPSGARPAGSILDPPGTPPAPAWVAAWVPNWPSAFYASRALSDNGRRLFFESFDALVLEDTNGKGDVYQWEAPGKGGCTPESAAFVEAAGGCIDLISSGESPQDSRFVDASSDGNDVFFKTEASLWPADAGLIDIYDARVNGGFIPPDPPAPICEGEACQSPPAPPAELTPASAAVEGPGNRVKPKKCRKGRRHGKPRCLKKQRPAKRRPRR
jgi:DNA-binding beta-propeller fold protein YncE